MCGICAFISDHITPDSAAFKRCMLALHARGPESSRTETPCVGVTEGFTHLAINGTVGPGTQPLRAAGMSVICNGEIYNHIDLAKRHKITLHTGSDCEVLAHLFQILHKEDPTGVTFARALDGVFAIVATDVESGIVTVVRDPYGIRPLYVATLSESEGWFFASEIKVFEPFAHMISHYDHFPPGHVGVYNKATKTHTLHRYHATPWLKTPALVTPEACRAAAREALTVAVRKRLMADRQIGCLLSGGFDSSIVTALVQRELLARGSPPVHTFSIGMSGSTDLKYARIVADHIGSVHHEILLTEDDFFVAILAVIAAIESYDITSVRASVGNYLVSKYIREHTDIKVVFNGDGSDEVAGSYLYFNNAPSDESFEAETVRLLDTIHIFDVRRSDGCISSHGLEARTPFLDKQFVATMMSMPTSLRRPVRGKRVEKQLIREAFDTPDVLLPSEVLWRTKEAFSDGVSGTDRSWYQAITERLATKYSAEEFETGCAKYDHNKPYTHESLWYREVFESLYGTGIEIPSGSKVIPYYWLPRWSGDAKDPSARTLSVYNEVTDVPDVAKN